MAGYPKKFGNRTILDKEVQEDLRSIDDVDEIPLVLELMICYYVGKEEEEEGTVLYQSCDYQKGIHLSGNAKCRIPTVSYTHLKPGK